MFCGGNCSQWIYIHTVSNPEDELDVGMVKYKLELKICANLFEDCALG